MEKKVFQVRITETLSKVVEVEATSADEATEIVQHKYSAAEEECILFPEDFVEVTIQAEE